MVDNDAFAARPGTARLREQLDRLGLGHWLPILAAWLPHYDGWRSSYCQDESIIEDEVPTEMVCGLLDQYQTEGVRPDDFRFAEDLAHLDFLTWRARHEKPGTRWVCLDESFVDFAARGNAELWQYDTEFPSPGIVKHWLLGRLFVTLREGANADGA